MIKTIAKASEVLALYDREHTEWGVRQVAQRLDMAKSSASDLLTSLAEIGVLNRTNRGRYELGWRLVVLSEVLLATAEIRCKAHPVIEEVAAEYQETVHLAILDDTKVVYIDKLEGKQAVRVELTSLGTRLYAHCSALGKVLLAYKPPEDVRRILASEGMPRFTPNTITDEHELAEALEKVRRQGYANDLEEVLPDLCCIAAPVHNYAGAVIAAISMSVPTYRFQRSEIYFRKAILNAAKRIENSMGYFGS